MRRVYAILPWGIIALGVVHIAAATRMYDTVTMPALWFVNGGIVLVVAGALNLVNRAYGATARGLRLFCSATNIVVATFSVVAGVVGHAGIGSMIFVIGLLGGVTALSLMPTALGMGRTAA